MNEMLTKANYKTITKYKTNQNIKKTEKKNNVCKTEEQAQIT